VGKSDVGDPAMRVARAVLPALMLVGLAGAQPTFRPLQVSSAGKITDDLGSPVLLRGLNRSGTGSGNADANATDQEYAAQNQLLSMNVVRLFVNTAWWTNNVQVPIAGMAYRDYIDSLIQRAKKYGNYVLILKAGQFPDAPCGISGVNCPAINQGDLNCTANPAVCPDQDTSGNFIVDALTFWDAFTQKYASDPAVLYDTWENMRGLDPNTWSDNENQLIATIRTNSPQSLIFVEDTGMAFESITSGVTPDFAWSNIVWNFHIYNGPAGACSDPISPRSANWPQNFDPLVSFAQQNGHAVAITEWGGCNDTEPYHTNITSYAKTHSVALVYFDSSDLIIQIGGVFQLTAVGMKVAQAFAAPPPAISSVSPSPVIAAVGAQTIFVNGTGFQNGAALRVHLFNGAFQTVVTPTFLSATQLSILVDVSTTAANWTAQVFNPDGQSSNVFAFTVAVPTTTSFALPQFTFGGGWYTALYFANTTNVVVHIQVNFYDDNGAPFLVTLLGIPGSVSSQSITVNPHSTVILEAPNSGGAQQEGWADVALPTGVTGYAVFRQTVVGRADQEAVVPLTPESSLAADLTYDDIAFTTAVAFLNPTTQPVAVSINAFDAAGNSAGSGLVVLAARSKQAITLKAISGLSGIAGKRGRVVFSASSGAVSVLGLRFGASAFTSIPVVHRPTVTETRTISFALPQFIFGGPWYNALYFSNTTNGTLNVQVSFIDDSGAQLSAPLVGIGSVSTTTVNLPPGATKVLEALNGGASSEGWAEVTLPPGVTGYAVFRQVIAGRTDQEAVVPLTSEFSQAADLVYDEVAFTTAIAFENPSDQQVIVTILVYNANGSQIGSAQIALAPRAKFTKNLKEVPGLSGVVGNRGWAAFSVPNGDVSVIGLRFGAIAFTSIPVNHR
jgi:hypothetical protein